MDHDHIYNQDKIDTLHKFTNESDNVNNNSVNELFSKLFVITSNDDNEYKHMINFDSSNIPPLLEIVVTKSTKTYIYKSDVATFNRINVHFI